LIGCHGVAAIAIFLVVVVATAAVFSHFVHTVHNFQKLILLIAKDVVGKKPNLVIQISTQEEHVRIKDQRLEICTVRQQRRISIRWSLRCQSTPAQFFFTVNVSLSRRIVCRQSSKADDNQWKAKVERGWYTKF